MYAADLPPEEQEYVLSALNECYRRLKLANLTAEDLSMDGFKLLFKCAYQQVVNRH
jgi:hypothetical protein